jgi:hypothetical protein
MNHHCISCERIPQNASIHESAQAILGLPVAREFDIARLRPASLPRGDRFETVADARAGEILSLTALRGSRDCPMLRIGFSPAALSLLAPRCIAQAVVASSAAGLPAKRCDTKRLLIFGCLRLRLNWSRATDYQSATFWL